MSQHEALTLAMTTGFAVAIIEILRDEAPDGTKEAFLQTLCSGMAVLVSGISAGLLGLELYLAEVLVPAYVTAFFAALILAVAILGMPAVGMSYQQWRTKQKESTTEASEAAVPPDK